MLEAGYVASDVGWELDRLLFDTYGGIEGGDGVVEFGDLQPLIHGIAVRGRDEYSGWDHVVVLNLELIDTAEDGAVGVANSHRIAAAGEGAVGLGGGLGKYGRLRCGRRWSGWRCDWAWHRSAR